MKKTIRTILSIAAFAVLAVSCQKEIGEAEPIASTKGTIEISINGLMGEYTQVDATKSTLVNTVRVAWEGNENVYVYDESSYLGELSAALDGKDNRYAILSGTIGVPTGNKLFLVHSPLLTEYPAIEGGKLSISLAEQTTNKAPFVVFATLDYTDANITGAIVPFTFATSVVRVSCTGLEPETAISSAAVSGVNTSCVLTFADGTVTASGANEDIITRLNADGFANVNAEGDASFQFAVPALGSSSTGRKLTVMQKECEYVDMKFSKASIETNRSVNTICSMVYMNNLVNGKFTVNANGKKVYFSKGNLQATYDGSSYSWGFAPNQYDIIGSGNEAIANPVEGTTLDLFGWSTASTFYGISTSTDNKYYSGDFVDWGRALGSNIWRTLTMEEWKYLVGIRVLEGETESGYGNTCVWATFNNVEGLIIFCDDYNARRDELHTIPDGCVFLPAAGRRTINSSTNPETSTKYEGKHLRYWSATPASRSQAHDFVSESDGCSIGTSTRNFGYPVRLVTDCE